MKITSPEQLAQALKNARKELGLTQQAAADLVGIKQATVSALENNPENSRLETLFKLLAALNLELKLSERGTAEQTSGWDQEW
ncbi:HTH-type transcriptional regulator/antitoxin HipB [Marinobacter pelagius]|uniref:HTH-type transcriptional regulator/antitoxin HipB n=1 Tax=Marinobacter pelagius TaxID=379482 RepID=A0A366GR94_9GAMM|nr:helix-turn-helix domain-containing protein [Marinobacter pelagius]RBP29963.1 HTH-type transcriptional regulator/antitoxin HipB [Marinobacter pelagius]